MAEEGPLAVTGGLLLVRVCGTLIFVGLSGGTHEELGHWFLGCREA